MGPNKTLGFHLFNLLIHLLAGGLLFGVVKRTVPRATSSLDADAVAALVTTVWLLHPLQSEAVNYVIQRTELIVSACYLATLYAWIRAWDAATARRRVAWRIVAVLACVLGMGSKEVMLTAPLMIVLYDRAFRVEVWRELLGDRQRLAFYGLLMATLGVGLIPVVGNARNSTVGFGLEIPWYRYLYSQAWAILHYLRLALWPNALTFDYGMRPITGLAGVPGLVALTVLGAATLLAWVAAGKWLWLAFLGAWFFLLLAPSSSIVPITTEIAAERRIYLAFAAVIVLAVVGLEAARRRFAARVSPHWPRPAAVALGLALATMTFLRSTTYAHAETLWRDTVAKAPDNPRAMSNLASTLFYDAPPRLDEARQLYERALAADSAYLPAWSGLASIAVDEHRWRDAETLLLHALAVDPDYSDAIDHLGRLYVRVGQPARAIPYLERYAKAYPSTETLVMLGRAYLQVGRFDAGALTLGDALELDPNRADALRDLGGLYAEQGRAAEAIPLLERAVVADTSNALGFALLSFALAESYRVDERARAMQLAQLAVEKSHRADASVAALAGRAMTLLGR